MAEVKQPDGLIAVLLDPGARVDERDDAAMDLGAHDAPAVVAALLQVARDAETDTLILASAGESLAEIWLRRGEFPADILATLQPPARREATLLIRASRPEWLQGARAS